MISAPIKGVLAIYAEENGEGIFFDAEDDAESGTEEVVQLKGIEGGSGGIESIEQQSGVVVEPSIGRAKPFLKLVE